MRDIFQNDGPRCGPFELCDSENAAIIAKHVSLVGEYFRENSGLIVIRLPNLILRPVNKNIFFDRMTMQIEEE